MKPLFSLDITNDTNQRPNSDNFLLARVSEQDARNFDEVHEKLGLSEQRNRYRTIPIPYIVLAILLVFTRAALRIFFDDEKSGIIGGVLLIVFTVLCVLWYVFSMKKRINERMSTTDIPREIECIEDAVEIPDDVDFVEFFAYRYKTADGKPVEVGSRETVELATFVDNGALIIVDMESAYEIPLSEMTEIREVRRRVLIKEWQKELEPSDPKYARLVTKKGNKIWAESYYELVIDRFGTLYTLEFPNYELLAVSSMTGISPEF